MKWVASTLHTTSEHGVTSITTADAHTSGCKQSTELTPPADLNGLVHCAERRNLVSARVPSHFKRSLPRSRSKHKNYTVPLSALICVSNQRCFTGRQLLMPSDNRLRTVGSNQAAAAAGL